MANKLAILKVQPDGDMVIVIKSNAVLPASMVTYFPELASPRIENKKIKLNKFLAYLKTVEAPSIKPPNTLYDNYLIWRTKGGPESLDFTNLIGAKDPAKNIMSRIANWFGLNKNNNKEE